MRPHPLAAATSLLQLLLSVAPATAAPQRIAGRVVDPFGLPIPAAHVILRHDATGLSQTVDTDASGQFTLTVTGEGPFVLTAIFDGFAPSSRTLREPATNIDLVLKPAGVHEDVVVVSASRQAELRESLSTKVDTVSSVRLRATAGESVGDVLRELPGVMTRRGSEGTGAAGQQIQGIDSRQVLVLLDGQPVVGARGIKSGALDLDRQTTARLQRVEVVKGASSALFGSDAIGGVINLITRDPAAPLDVHASVSGGQHGIVDASSEVGLTGRGWTLFGTAGERQRNAFDLTPTTFDTTGADVRRRNLFGKSVWQAAPRLSIAASVVGEWNRQRGRSVGELGPQDSTVRDRSGAYHGRLAWQADGRTFVEARAYRGEYDERTQGRLAPPSSAELAPATLVEELTKADASLSRTLDAHQMLQAGAEWMQDMYAGVNRTRDESGERATTAVVWLQDRISVANRVSATIGARLDRHSIFGHAFSPKAGLNVRLPADLRARASYGHGFRAPDLGQLFYRFLNPTNFYQIIGNPGLRPERSRSWQAGLDYAPAATRVRGGVTVFRNRVRDLIESVNLGTVSTQAQLDELIASQGVDPSFRPQLGRMLFIYRNVAQARTQGVELDGEWRAARAFTIGGAYTYLDAVDTRTRRALTNRSRHHGSVRVFWTSERLGLDARANATLVGSWIATTGRGTTPAAVAPSFFVINAFTAKRLGRGLEVFGAIDNLANSQDPNTGVLLANGTPAPIYRPEIGRTIRTGVRWSWSRR